MRNIFDNSLYSELLTDIRRRGNIGHHGSTNLDVVLVEYKDGRSQVYAKSPYDDDYYTDPRYIIDTKKITDTNCFVEVTACIESLEMGSRRAMCMSDADEFAMMLDILRLYRRLLTSL